jgi:hypothetical protein
VADDSARAAIDAADQRDVEGEPFAEGDDPEQLAGGAVAEEGSGSAGEDGSEPASLLRDQRVADRVDAAVERVEMAATDQPLDPILADAGREELAPSDDAALTLGRRADARRASRLPTVIEIVGSCATQSRSVAGCPAGAPHPSVPLPPVRWPAGSLRLAMEAQG